MLLNVNHLEKIYNKNKENPVLALKDLSFSVTQGEFVAIMGESGSGKTTLLNILAMLDEPSRGDIYLEDKNISQLKDQEKAAFRRRELGYVFQQFNLLDQLTVQDNILLPLVLMGVKAKDLDQPLERVVGKLGIQTILKKYPYQISGGQGQRVAIARALITNPKLILADEPTGALDSKTSEELLHYFSIINNQGQTILMVTHSAKAASVASRVLFIKDGKIFHQIYKGDATRQVFINKINQSMAVTLGGGVLE